MFATLLGALPISDEAGRDRHRAVEIAVQAQEQAGLEPITDGRLRGEAFGILPNPDAAVASWRATAAITDRAVKQALPGPLALGGGIEAFDALAAVVTALAEAGCPLVEIEESALDRLADDGERGRFRAAHEGLLERLAEQARSTHLSLSIVGGAPPEDAWATVVGLPYASLAVDLIAGSDSWNLVTRWPGDRGVIVGAESGREPDEPKEVLLWGARYAASTRGRGLDRVGIGSAGSWSNLSWEVAVRKMRILGEVARLAVMPLGQELAGSLDPRAVSARAAALGTAARPAHKPSGR